MTAILTGGAAADDLRPRRGAVRLAASCGGPRRGDESRRGRRRRPADHPTGGHVAETRRLQRSLSSAASLLEKRARERDAEIQRADAARAEAEQASRTKDQFLAVLGHELRNPLAPALTALELMKARDPQAFARERQILERQVAHMVAAGQRSARRVAPGARQGPARAAPLRDPRRGRSRRRHGQSADRPARHTLDVSVPASGLTIDADIARIVQVLSNLLTNAAKYTPPGGRIALTARRVGGSGRRGVRGQRARHPRRARGDAVRSLRPGATDHRSERRRPRAGAHAGAHVRRDARRDNRLRTPRRGRQPLHRDAAAGGRRRGCDAGGARLTGSPGRPCSGFCWSTTISTPTRCCSRPSRRPGTTW